MKSVYWVVLLVAIVAPAHSARKPVNRKKIPSAQGSIYKPWAQLTHSERIKLEDREWAEERGSRWTSERVPRSESPASSEGLERVGLNQNRIYPPQPDVTSRYRSRPYPGPRVSVRGYRRKDGRYVRPHSRRLPRR